MQLRLAFLVASPLLVLLPACGSPLAPAVDGMPASTPSGDAHAVRAAWGQWVRPVEGQPIAGVPGVATTRALVRFSDLPQRRPFEGDHENDDDEIPAPLGPRYDLPLLSAGLAPEMPDGQAAGGTLSLPSPPLLASFAGIDGTTTNLVPPDVSGAVGPTHVVEHINSQVRVMDRSGSPLSTVTLTAFWQKVGFARFPFDPHLRFDPYAQRWIAVAVADAASKTSALLVGASQTADPTGQWNLYKVMADPAGVYWADFPSVGFNRSWVVVQLNYFPIGSGNFDHSEIYVFDKGDLYAGGVGRHTRITDASLGLTQCPADTLDPALDTEYLVQNGDGHFGDQSFVRLFTVTGPVGSEVLTPGPSVSAGGQSWSFYAPGINVGPQSGSSQKLDTGDARVRNVVYRDGALWTSHTTVLPVGVGTRTGVQWWQIDPVAGRSLQRGLLDDSTGATSYAYPNISVGKGGHAVVSYARFSSSEYAGASYALHAAGDPPGTLRGEARLKAGQAPYALLDGSGRNRWGDYSVAMTDPSDDGTLWIEHEFANASGRWATWWGHVDPVNPAFAATADQTVAENSPLSFTVSAVAAGGQTLSFSSSGLPAGASFDTASQRFDWTPGYGTAGTYKIQLRVSDGRLFDVQTVSIRVTHTDRAPVLAAIGDQMGAELSQLTFTASASDPDGDSITYSAQGLPAGAFLDATSGAFRWTPSTGQAGVYDLSISASDGTLSDRKPVRLTIAHTDTPPQFGPYDAQTVDEGQPLEFTVTATDADGDPVSVMAAGLPMGAIFDPGTGVLRWTPAPGQAGPYTITFTASDGKLSATLMAGITVRKVNFPPHLAAVPSLGVAEGSALKLQLVATDPDGDTLSFGSSPLPRGAHLDSVSGVLSWTPDFGQAGLYPLTFSVSDGRSADMTSTQVTVRHTNRPPVLAPIADQTVVERDTLRFTVSAVDPDGDAVSIAQRTLPAGASLDSRGQFEWTPDFGRAGDYHATFSATDGTATTQLDVHITVTAADRAPQIAAVPPQSTLEGKLLRFTVSASDPDGEVVTLAARALPPGASFDAATGTFAWTPARGQAGVYSVEITASDARKSTSLTAMITVTAGGPVLAPLADQSITVGHALAFMLMASEVGGGALSYSAAGLPPGATLDGAGHFSWTPGADQVGDHAVTFKVSDGALGDSAAITIHVHSDGSGCGCRAAGERSPSSPLGATMALVVVAGALLRRRARRN